ncbi:uncharacterized protein LOC100214365 isoform X1 [Hydra vulgaris]|uniref:uncharacterized protein LOC100214365 isoform X1 n=1 Tax=Hydra vulgaris TaxID=6087 RepID=UPI001F5FA298|nr:uncharacterized protein LOC100214365 isoform X1 [Hydra vulgaris]
MISYFVFLLLPQLYLLQLVKLPDTTQNGAKRFTLQDLLGNQQLQQQQEQPKTQTVDLGTLIAAARNAAINQQQQTQTQEVLLPSPNLMQQFSPNPNNNKEIDIDVQPDKNGNINLDDLQGMLSSPSGSLSSPSTNKNNAIEKTQISASTEGSMINDLIAQPQGSSLENHIVHEELDLGKQKIELEAAGKRTTHYTLARSKDGGLNLIPIVEGGSGKLEMLQSKGYEEQGKSRQQMQLTTLSQALYSPFPSDQNILHLHLKGKDGKDGKPGNKGPMGPMGPRGPEGSRGPKGDAGTCSSQINGLFECTPDELDSLSNRIDYLEKICKKKAPPPPFRPIGVPGTEGNPLPSCQAIYEKNPNAKSGPYWLMVSGIRFKTWCEFFKGGGSGDDERPALAGGWTLVARVKGQATDWSPVSELWANNETLNEGTASDIKRTTSMKNIGFNLITSNVLLLCFTGPNTGCAIFTHGKNMPLSELFATKFGVVPEEQYTMANFMKAVGKSCDLSILRQSWCGLNLANVCDAKRSNPNDKPPTTTHIVRIGCIGDRSATCFPDDYAVGIGVTSCKDGYGCSNVGPSKNMHYRCDYVYGAFSQTAFIYVL